MSLPPTDKNIYPHIRLAHLHMLFGSQYKQGRANVTIIDDGWEVKDGITCPCIDVDPPGPQHLMNVKTFSMHTMN